MRTIPNALWMSAALSMTITRLAAQGSAPLAEAEEGPVLQATAGANDNRCAVVYNPEAGLYYSIDAGCKRYPVDTYDEEGTLLATAEQGFDYRGAWWNPATGQLEGNGYKEGGLFVQALDAAQRPLGEGREVLGVAQPDDNAVGTLDPEANEVIYYHAGMVYRYARTNNASVAIVPITGLPAAFEDLNDNTVAYTGIAGYEWALYDHVRRRVLFVDKRTGAYAGACQLPESAPARTSFGMSWANGKFWLFDAPTNPGTWRSYGVSAPVQATAVAPSPQQPIALFPVPADGQLNVVLPEDMAFTTARVLDDQGRMVAVPLQRTGPGAARVDTGVLPVGAYVLEVVAGAERSHRPFTVAR